MNKAELTTALVGAGFKEDALKDLTNPMLEAMLDGVSSKNEIETLTEINNGLMAKLSQNEFEAKNNVQTLKHDGKLYAITSPSFTHAGKKYTAKELQEDKKLQKELIEGGYGTLSEIVEESKNENKSAE